MLATAPYPTPIPHERIETERLILRAPVFSDAPGLYALLSDPEISKYSPYPPFASVADVHFVVVSWREAREQGLRTFVGALRSDPAMPIGFVQIGPDEEIGGSISPKYAGGGLTTEALEAVVQRLGLRNAWTIIDAEHEGLIQTLAKVGIVKDRLLPAHRVHPQISSEKRDCVLLRQQSK
jgi:RimJ/RimL family protein N-acetyltransferase